LLESFKILKFLIVLNLTGLAIYGLHKKNLLSYIDLLTYKNKNYLVFCFV